MPKMSKAKNKGAKRVSKEASVEVSRKSDTRSEQNVVCRFVEPRTRLFTVNEHGEVVPVDYRKVANKAFTKICPNFCASLGCPFFGRCWGVKEETQEEQQKQETTDNDTID